MISKSEIITIVLLLLSPSSLVWAVSRSIAESGTQFIFYNGTINGSLEYNAKNDSACGKPLFDSFSNLRNSSMKIGINGPWDANPFFFELTLDGPDGVPSRLSDLSFATTYFICYDEGERCGFIELWPWYYVPAQMLDLNSASVSVVKEASIGENESGPFYSVLGDENTWVSNGTVDWNQFNVDLPSNYSRRRMCGGNTINW